MTKSATRTASAEIEYVISNPNTNRFVVGALETLMTQHPADAAGHCELLCRLMTARFDAFDSDLQAALDARAA